MTRRRVLVIGGSDQGRQAIDVLEAAGSYEVVGICDRAIPRGTDVVGYPVVARDDEVAQAAAATDAEGFLVAIGDNAARGHVVEATRAACPGLVLVSAIHPTATISPRAQLGPGTIVMAHAVVSNGCRLGTGVLVGTKASLDHDCVVGDYASLAPNVTTGGRVQVGEYSALLLSASVINGVTIGAHTVVGAAALVRQDLPDRVVAYGVPARVARPRAEGEPYL